MDIKNAIAKLELMEDGTIKFDNFDEAYAVFQIFLDHNEPTLIARLLNALMTLREYEWVKSFLSEDIMAFIEKCEDLNAKLRLYNTIIYLSHLDEIDERIVTYTNRLAKLDNLELPILTSAYMIGISTLAQSQLYEEAVTFADKLLNRINCFGMLEGPKFSAYVNCYKVYSNTSNPNIDLVNRLRNEIEVMLEDEEFADNYGDIYEFVKLEAEWIIAKKAKNLYKKKFVADESVERLINALKNKDLDLSGIDYIFDIIKFYIEIGCEEPIEELEPLLFDYYKMSDKKITLANIYAKYYDSIGNTAKAYEYYKSYANWMAEIETKLSAEKKSRYKDIFKQAQLSTENETLQKTIMYDEVTNCFSREYLKYCFKNKFTGSFLLIDLDNVKEINEELGHVFGDKYIGYFASILKRHVGKYDGDIYRFGGVEFVVVLPNVLEQEEVTKFIDKFYSEFDQPHNVMDQVMFIRFSTGITIAEDYTLSEGFNEADQALYKMKASGKNKYMFF